MKAEDYYNALNDFTTRHGISRDIMERLSKVKEEFTELGDAIYGCESDERVMSEAADLLNVCADIIIILGGDPLQVAMQKLEEAAARPHYQLIAADVAAGRQSA